MTRPATASFATEAITCDKCLQAAREIISGRSQYHEGQEVGIGSAGFQDGILKSNAYMVVGTLKGVDANAEIDLFEVHFVPLLAPRLCHGHTLRVMVHGLKSHRMFHLDPLQGGGILRAMPRWWGLIDAVHRAVAESMENEPYRDADGQFLMIALAGEVGEAANELKKLMRGDYGRASDEERAAQPRRDKRGKRQHRAGFAGRQRWGAKFEAELADARIMLELVARYSNTDLDAAVEDKIPKAIKKLKREGVIPEDWNGGGAP